MSSSRLYKISRGYTFLRQTGRLSNNKEILEISPCRIFGIRCSYRKSSTVYSTYNFDKQKELVWKLFYRKYPHSIAVSDKQTSRRYSTYPSHEVVKLPNLSPTMEVGTIVSWEKSEGERVEEGEVLAIIETDKSTMEMETPEEGYLAKILQPVGSKDILVNQPIAILANEEEDIAAFKDYIYEVTEVSSQQASEHVEVSSKKQSSTPSPQPSQPPSPPPFPKQSTPPEATMRVFASPLAKRTALARGININKVVGTGPRGRITLEDIEAFKPVQLEPTFSQQITLAQPSSAANYTDFDLTSMRKTIAKRLAESKQTVPHYYLTVDINMDKILKLRQQLNDSDGLKLSINDFIIKASALSLKKVPQCNSHWMTDFIREFHNVDICVAVSTESGLITPIVFDADMKGLHTINTDMGILAEKARNKTIKPHEFMGGTFTISNLGMFGITNFSAVINPPQSCILAVGATEGRLIPDATTEQGFKKASMMSVTLSCDHRVVDGAVGAHWLKTFRAFLEDPITMLL